MKYLPIIAALLVAPSASYACDSVLLHGLSYHSDRDLIEGVNEINVGIGCVRKLQNVSAFKAIEFGGYLNSHESLSVYWNATTNDEGLGLFVGMASGYEDDAFNWEGVMPQAGLQYTGETLVMRAGPSVSAEDGQFGIIFSLSAKVWTQQPTRQKAWGS